MKTIVLQLVSLACLLVGTPAASGAETNAPLPVADTPRPATISPAPAVPLEEPALLNVFNRPVGILRASLFGNSPRQRVRQATERISALIHRKVFGPIETHRRADGLAISVGGEVVMMITPGDVDPFSGKNLEDTAAEVVQLLGIGLNEAKTQTSVEYVVRACLKAGAATLLLLALLFVLVRTNRYLQPRVMAAEGKIADQLKRRGLATLAHVTAILHWGLRLLFWVTLGVGLFEWMAFSLRCFPYTRPWGDGLQENFADFLGGIVSAAVRALPNLLIIALIVLATRGVVGLVRAFFRGIESGRIAAPWVEGQAVHATQRIVIVVIWLFAIVMMYPYVPGSSSAAFKGMTVFVGLLVSLGSSSVVGQFTSGLVLMYSRALRRGEYVRIGEHEGTVETLGFLSTKIRSPKNEELHVPNLVILGSSVKNYSRLARAEGVWLPASISIGYDAPWRQVHAMLIEAARRTPGLYPEPPPFVLQTLLADFYVEYQVNARLVEPDQRLKVLTALHANIQDVFNEYGVQIMSPHFMADKAQPVVVPREKWHCPPATPDPLANKHANTAADTGANGGAPKRRLTDPPKA